MSDEQQLGYVGYGTPPKHTQFKKGKSGNPKGRPRKKYLYEVLEQVMDEVVTINSGGEKKKMTKKEATIQKLLVDCINGKSSAVKNLIELMSSFNKMHPL